MGCVQSLALLPPWVLSSAVYSMVQSSLVHALKVKADVEVRSVSQSSEVFAVMSACAYSTSYCFRESMMGSRGSRDISRRRSTVPSLLVMKMCPW